MQKNEDVEGLEVEPGRSDDASEFISKTGKIYAVLLTLVFVGSGIAFALYTFPELSTIRAVIAGLCFGGFLALCSITYSAL
ncbi:MAG: hypothetical protein ACON3Z_12080 [Bradymonadia bacterium]